MASIISVLVMPSAGSSGFFLDKAGRFKCRLKSPPEKGKANKELISLLAKTLGCPKSEIEIVAGLTSRSKRICLPISITQEKLLKKLGLELQEYCF